MISLALFNNKGGVGKTTLTYHLAHMMQRIGHRVLAVDLDPQSNLTAMFLDPEEIERLWGADTELFGGSVPSDSSGRSLNRTIGDAVRPLAEQTGGVRLIDATEMIDGLWLLPGSLDLSPFEDKLAKAWLESLASDIGAIRVMTAFHQVIQHAARQVRADVVLIDVASNLGAINRAALLSADTVLMPLAADMFSLLGLHNLGPRLAHWRQKWQRIVVPDAPVDLTVPKGTMDPIGYVVMQPSIRLDRPVRAYQRWLSRIPAVYAESVLPDGGDRADHRIATIRTFRSLMPLAHDARKPMFDLKASDGAIGSTQKYVQLCYREFEEVARRVLDRLGIGSPQ